MKSITINQLVQQYSAEDHLVVAEREVRHILQCAKIIRLEAEGSYTVIYFTDRKPIICSKYLRLIAERLNPKSFCRTHKSHVINLQAMKSYEEGRGGYVIMNDGTKITVSVRRKAAFMETLHTYAATLARS
ncbi:MAG TPA: LytTR family DNA-binding domain-containing protein [Bacteroidia bacterium]|nr:LytTR family DNA-binding domain-containing protein [Bacteroidia bacterium]